MRKINRVHLFWYHSPVRFMRKLEDFHDMTNPQNTQYFGSRKPYPLEKGVKHRFLLPKYGNTISQAKHELYIVNDREKVLLESSLFVENGYLKYITFQSDIDISGRLEIIDSSTNKTVFYSNCVRFLDSTDSQGRKYIRIATKHSYNRNLFEFENQGAWMLTNLPAYCLGETSIDIDISNSRIGGNSTLRARESYLDEVVHYQFKANGDANILNFIQVHATNNYFFIDGTQRTCIDKIDKDDFSMFGKIGFTNIKDSNGLNILLNEDDIFNPKTQPPQPPKPKPTETIITAKISWQNLPSAEELTGKDEYISVAFSASTNNPNDGVKRSYWEVDNGEGFNVYEEAMFLLGQIPLKQGENRIRLKVVTKLGNVGYSNILKYKKI